MNWKILCVTPSHSLLDALAVIEQGVCQMALVTDGNAKLLGVLSDGDTRRALLQGCDLQTAVCSVMSNNPVTVTLAEGRGVALLRLREKQLRRIPVLDNAGCLCDLWSLEELLEFSALPNPVVLMAGGLGTRLAPLTDDTPKPMLPVGGQPLLELTMDHFRRQGFRQFYITVNYKAQCITEYFGDGSRFGISITYIHEHKRLGTAGALSLLPPFSLPCIVMNGDILTRLNFIDVLKTHEGKAAPGTMVIKKHMVQIPYGVVRRSDDFYMEGIEEKPQHSFAVSAGINVLSPEVMSCIPHNTFYDMPELFSELLRRGMRPAVHEMTEYWLDIGRISDYRRANEEFSQY